MLNKLRNKKTAKWLWIILGMFILPPFLFWGLGSVMRSKQEKTYAGKIFGQKVSFVEYRDAMRAVENQTKIQFGDNFAALRPYLNLEEQAWNRLILLYEAKKQNINATDKEVVEFIQTFPIFQRNGKFDSALYNQLLKYFFRSRPREFEEETRQNLMLGKLYRLSTADIKVSEDEIREQYRKSNAELSVNYILASAAQFKKQVDPKENEIRDYFSLNALTFKQPVLFNLEYLFSESEEKIKEAAKKVNAKLGFDAIAKELGIDFKETGPFSQLDPIPGIGWSPEVLGLVSKLKPAETSRPLKVDKYYYILRLKERKEPHIPDFEEIRDKVKEKVTEEKSKDMAKERIESCRKELEEAYLKNPKSVDLEKSSKTHGLKYGATELFKYGSYLEGIGSTDELWVEAEGLADNALSRIVELPSGFYILKVKSRAPFDEKKFSEEKEEFGKKLLEKNKLEYFAKYIEELKKNAK
ncbi:MAG: SurA N-terminal domain-containing protein [Candidatus Omnitrophota bacterium]